MKTIKHLSISLAFILTIISFSACSKTVKVKPPVSFEDIDGFEHSLAKISYEEDKLFHFANLSWQSKIEEVELTANSLENIQYDDSKEILTIYKESDPIQFNRAIADVQYTFNQDEFCAVNFQMYNSKNSPEDLQADLDDAYEILTQKLGKETHTFEYDDDTALYNKSRSKTYGWRSGDEKDRVAEIAITVIFTDDEISTLEFSLTSYFPSEIKK